MGTGKMNKPARLKNLVSWFGIPAINFQQAVNFYNYIYGIEMETFASEVNSIAYFPIVNGVGGAIVAGAGSTPSDHGPLIYLNGGTDLNNVAGKIEEAGGRIILPKTWISEEGGYYAIFIDSEGNKLALHSNS